MSEAETMRLLVKQRVHAVVEEAFGELDRLTADYEETVSRLREHELHRSDVQQLLEIKAEVPPEDMDLDQEDPESLHINSGGSGPARNLNPHRHSPPNADDENASESSETEVSSGDRQEAVSDSGPESEDRDNVWKETRAPEKRFRCDVCGKRFNINQHLKTHMRVHTGEKPFSCDVCDKRFTQQGSLTKHTRVHTGERPFSCDVCDKRFNINQHLKTHMRVHTGEKTFSCDVCEKRFARRGTLKRHMMVHTAKKPFGCDVCGNRFTQPWSLKKHMRVHTG